MTQPLKLLTMRMPLSPLAARDRQLLERHKIGGICLFRGEYTHLTDALLLLERLYGLLGPEVLISVDQEGGGVVRLPQLPHSPGGFALSSADDPELTYEVALVQARALRLAGFNVNFAPVLDIMVNPRNPVIGDRALGLTPEAVIRHALPFLRAHQDAGILAVGKHYPGHGDTDVDSHLGLPMLDKTFDDLEQLELKPYRAAFEAGLEAVMTAHITFPRLSPLPATLSPEILGYLRGELGFDGLIFTDALDMQAVIGEAPPWEVALDALKAGADQLLVLDRDQLEATCERFQPDPALAAPALARFGRAVQKYPFQAPQRDALEALLQDHACREPIRRAARRAVASSAPLEPLLKDARLLFLVPGAVTGGAASDPDSLAARLRPRVQRCFPLSEVLEYDPAAPNLEHIEDALDDAERVILVTAQRVKLQEGHLKIAVLLRGHPRALHANLWNPFLSAELGLPAVHTFGFSDASLDALLGALESGEVYGTLEV